MHLQELQALIQLLRANDVEYYKSGEVELYLRRQPGTPVPLAAEAPSEPVPEIMKKLPKNYSHPALFPSRKAT